MKVCLAPKRARRLRRPIARYGAQVASLTDLKPAGQGWGDYQSSLEDSFSECWMSVRRAFGS